MLVVGVAHFVKFVDVVVGVVVNAILLIIVLDKRNNEFESLCIVRKVFEVPLKRKFFERIF